MAEPQANTRAALGVDFRLAPANEMIWAARPHGPAGRPASKQLMQLRHPERHQRVGFLAELRFGLRLVTEFALATICEC